MNFSVKEPVSFLYIGRHINYCTLTNSLLHVLNMLSVGSYHFCQGSISVIQHLQPGTHVLEQYLEALCSLNAALVSGFSVIADADKGHV